MCEMKWRSSSLSTVSQSCLSDPRSISSVVQKDATAFLYIRHSAGCWMGKSTKRAASSVRRIGSMKFGSGGSAAMED